ncbi:DUF2867 domain-containing protein [Streptomyces mobaraensis]|uniref:DUF2867 domain-containing protein n=1 Tax=Streptomyces mobaraensis TaxID=35621 RepID=UPI000996758E|nr:DUF2867 domain-containing protein [Streptomyces mobaraensis]
MKPDGLLGRAYMAAIKPFRYTAVPPGDAPGHRPRAAEGARPASRPAAHTYHPAPITPPRPHFWPLGPHCG